MNSESSNVCGAVIRSESSGRLWSVNKQMLKYRYQRRLPINVSIQLLPQENRQPFQYCTQWQIVTPFTNGNFKTFKLVLTKDDLENTKLDCVETEFTERNCEDWETSEFDDLELFYKEIDDLKGIELLPLYAYCVNKKFYVGCPKSKKNPINKDDPRIFTVDHPYLQHEYSKGNKDKKPTSNSEYYVGIKKKQLPVCVATQQKCVEVSQQGGGEVVQEECSEVPHQEQRDEETEQECCEVTQQERSEETEQECGEVPQKECYEATQQEYGEFSFTGKENIKKATYYSFSLTLVETKENAGKWDLDPKCVN